MFHTDGDFNNSVRLEHYLFESSYKSRELNLVLRKLHRSYELAIALR